MVSKYPYVSDFVSIGCYFVNIPPLKSSPISPFVTGGNKLFNLDNNTPYIAQ